MRAARRRTTEADLVILELVRLVTVEPWNLEVAAQRLLAKAPTVGALWRARARVLRAQTRHATILGRRAEDVLHEALAQKASALDLRHRPA